MACVVLLICRLFAPLQKMHMFDKTRHASSKRRCRWLEPNVEIACEIRLFQLLVMTRVFRSS